MNREWISILAIIISVFVIVLSLSGCNLHSPELDVLRMEKCKEVCGGNVESITVGRCSCSYAASLNAWNEHHRCFEDKK